MEIVKTGIPGFDEIAGGGFAKNRSILLQGNSGTGKTTFALQYLISGASDFNENGLYLSLEYDPTFLLEDMQSYDWPINQLIDNKKLRIISPKGGLENPVEMNEFLKLFQGKT